MPLHVSNNVSRETILKREDPLWKRVTSFSGLGACILDCTQREERRENWPPTFLSASRRWVHVTSHLTFLSSQPCWLPSNCEPNKPFLTTARMYPRYLTLLKRCSSSCRQLAHIPIWIVSLRERRTVFDLWTSKHCWWTGTSRLWHLFQGVENRSTEIWKGSKRQ